jgi:hypothetical protein
VGRAADSAKKEIRYVGFPACLSAPKQFFRARPGVFRSVPRNLIQRKSLLTSRKDAQENLAARTAWRQFLDKNGTSPLRSNKVALVSPWSDFGAPTCPTVARTFASEPVEVDLHVMGSRRPCRTERAGQIEPLHIADANIDVKESAKHAVPR